MRRLLISLPGLPCFPPLSIGGPIDKRLQRMAAVQSLPRPLITGFDSRSAGIVRARLAPLADPLAAHVPDQIRSPAFKQRSAFEARIADGLPPVTRAMLSDADEWLALLHDIAFRVHGSETALRTTPIGTEPGYGGNIMTYPPVAQIRPSLWRIARQVASHRQASLSEIAAYVMLACTTVHPFLDGNGRTARIVFNLVLRSEFPGLPYIAIKEITLFSAGDFLIATNRVHFQKDWGPYFGWLAAILDIHLAIGEDASDEAA